MGEIVEIEREAAAFHAHNVAHRLQHRRLAVRRQAHDLVFVAVVREPEELGDGRVEDAERVREADLTVDVDALVIAAPPHRADKVAESVDGKHGRVAERSHEECRGEMRAVMLDVVKPRPERRDVEGLGDLAADVADFRAVLETPFDCAERRSPCQQEGGALQHAGFGIAVDGDVIDVVEGDLRLIEAVADGRGRESRPVLYASETLLFRCRHQFAVNYDCGSSIGVVCVNA